MATKLIEARPTTRIHPLFDPTLTINNGSGELKSVGVSDGIGYHYFRIVIDGNELVSAKLGATASGNLRANVSLPVGLRFEHSVLVEGSSNVKAPMTRYWVVAQTDSSRLDLSEYFTEDYEGITVRFRRDTYVRDDESEYTITVSLGPERICRIDLQNDLYIWGRESVSGVITLQTVDGDPLSESSVELALRVAGSQREFPIRRGPFPRAVEGQASFELSSDTIIGSIPDLVGRQFPPFVVTEPFFELVSTLDGYANYPATFRLI
jgi:hypothetical protein